MITEKDLEVLSLNSNLTKLYLATLRAGSQTASSLAAATGLNRSNVYSLLEQLEAKNLVVVSFEGNKRRYRAGDPEIVARLASERLQAVNQLMPELKALYGAGAANPKLSFFDGDAALKKVCDELLEADSIRYMGGLETQTIVERFAQDMASDNPKSERLVRSRVIRLRQAEQDPARIVGDGRSSEVRFFPKTAPVHSPDLYLCGRKFIVMATSFQRAAMIIDSARLSALLTQIWDVVWEVSLTLEEVQRRMSSESRQAVEGFGEGV
jgi:sugar-specific transcriptional regulator TrmB